MKAKWSEMSCKKKILTVAYIIIAIITIVFAVIDIAQIWKPADNLWSFSFAALCGIACLQKWNENRKAAIIELVCGIILVAVTIGSMYI